MIHNLRIRQRSGSLRGRGRRMPCRFVVVAAALVFAFTAFANAQSTMLNAYYPQWGIYPGYLYYPKNLVSNSTAPLLTNLIYAFASVQNGHCAIGDSWADYQYPYTAATSIDGNADTNASGAL